MFDYLYVIQWLFYLSVFDSMSWDSMVVEMWRPTHQNDSADQDIGQLLQIS
jgi:hypothetical protein